jgi:8-hydroxy-5-deazaflavin:NADPH oxidoreductase
MQTKYMARVFRMGGSVGCGGMREFVAYFTKGLGDVVAGELRELLRTAGERVGEPGERFVLVTTGLEGAERVLAGARTVDDLRLLVAGPEPVADEAGFRALCTAAARRAEEFLVDDPARVGAAWSVTVSARKPPWAGRSGWSPGEVIAATLHGADVAGTERAPVDLRVQVDGEVMHVAVSLGGLGGGRRADRGENRPVNRQGALRPTVAAAMVRMALARLDAAGRGGGPGAPGRARVLYDPFAGTGTIVAEAVRMGLGVFASDVDPEAVRLTRERLTGERVARLGAAGGDEGALAHRVFEHDVRQGAARRVRADLVVGNMPWGKQVEIPRRQELFDGTAEVIRPVLTTGGVAVLLTTHEEQFTARLRRALPGTSITTRRIGLLGQTPAIVTVSPAALRYQDQRPADLRRGGMRGAAARLSAGMKIAVIGTGNIGGTLGRRWLAAGHEVAYGSRAGAGQAPDGAPRMPVGDAVADADVVVLAVPGGAVAEVVAAAGAALNGKVVIDAVNRIGEPEVNSRAVIADAAQQARYVRAFNTLGWENFADPVPGTALFFAADASARAVAEELITAVGLEPVFAGDAAATGTVDALLPLWFVLVKHNGGNRRVALSVAR